MSVVRLGIIGVGGMGSMHARWILDGGVDRVELTALCDLDRSKLEPFPGPKHYTRSRSLIRSGNVDAVLIATPHYAHTTIGADALQSGLHVLVEKPISVHKADCEKLIAAHQDKNLVFGAMFQQRTQPVYRKMKELLDSGTLGEIRRVMWEATHWFRSQAYYDSGGWRATWKGEGGGVLLNQAPHDLDMITWLCGMPSTVRGFCEIGKYHHIEVEDDVTTYLRYPNGATGVFVSTTAEAPGVMRIEIAGDNGLLVKDESGLTLIKNETPTLEFCNTTQEKFAKPKNEKISIEIDDTPHGHCVITQNFVNAILDGEPLLAHAEEGIKSVELANAMLFSSLLGKPVEIPMDSAAFARRLRKLIRTSTFEKAVKEAKPENMEASFH